MIRKVGSKYILYSKTTHKRLGVFRSKKKAKERERQIQYFKHLNK
ncbi:MAG TPA: hypothetical protein VJH34_00505 [archaeon]|nr:hypothetical protein [archaeon]